MDFLPMAFFWNNRKAAETNAVNVSFSMGREALYGQEGIIAYSKGIAKMKVTIKEVTPVQGSTTTKDIEKILDQKDIDIGVFLGGKQLRNSMAVLEAEWASNTEKGVIEGTIVLEGAKPRVTG
jgi:hypothetical protein